MTATARQLETTPLGAGRWRVALQFSGQLARAERPPRPHPREVALRGVPGAVLEALSVAMPSTPGCFSVVVAMPEPAGGGAPPLLELIGPDWSASIELPQAGPPPSTDDSLPAAIDYTARDFTALRTMLLAVIDETAGRGLADHPVAETAALAEQLAYLGDALSYSQDGTATEAYLTSARRRISVRRHAELLDYEVGTARSARAWVRFGVSEPVTLPAGTQLLAKGDGLPGQIDAFALPGALAAGALVFETLGPVSLEPDPAALQLAGGQDAPARLAAGAVQATVVGTHPGLIQGALVLIEPAAPLAIPAGQVIRLTEVVHHGGSTVLRWGREDALAADTALTQVDVQLRAGNLVLADQAQTHDWTELAPPQPGKRYWPELPVRNPAYLAGAPAATEGSTSAAAMLAATGQATGAAVELRAGGPGHWRSWFVRDTLLDSGPFDPGFVVEVEDGGGARLRFGDGTNGMQPPVGARFQVRVRSGGGSAGNVGIGAIAHLVGPVPAVAQIGNPTRAVGGADPEPLATVRLNAPTAFRITDRAVSARDYSRVALAVEGVTDATTAIVNTGTGPLARIRIHAGDWTTPTAPLVTQVVAAIERRRPAGVALDVAGATPVAVTIDLEITVQAGWALAAITTTIDAALAPHVSDPHSFGFATSLYRSEVIAWLAGLPGVLDVTPARFRWTGDARDAPALEHLMPGFGQIIRIDDDPTAPGNGSVSFRLRQETAP